MKVTEQTIKDAAQHATAWTYQHLIATTDVERIVALEAAKDAGDHFAQALGLSLRERGVEITK
jgi:hypothetical protein